MRRPRWGSTSSPPSCASWWAASPASCGATASAASTPSQVSALVSISRHAPVRPGDLAGIEGVAAPTLTRIVAWLEQEQLVERRDDPLDGRSSLLS